MRGLGREGMDIAQQQAIERRALLNRTQKWSGLDPVASPSKLDVLIVRTLVRAEEERKATHAFTTIDADLNALRVRAGRHDRHDAAIEKKCIFNWLVGRNDRPIDFQFERLKMRSQQSKIRR